MSNIFERGARVGSWAVVLVSLVVVGPVTAASGEGGSRLPDEAIPPQVEDFPVRPRLLIELGEPFLGNGRLGQGVRSPTGANWRPALWVFGSFRTAIQSFDGDSHSLEWTNQLDLFANLRLAGAERVLVGFRPLDGTNAAGYTFSPSANEGWRDDFNGSLEHLFFEGDLGELFPFVDPKGFGSTDLGLSVGRQDLFLQEGILINDNIDAVGLARNSLRPGGTSNLLITALYGWDNVNRGDNLRGNNITDDSVHLLALLTEVDVPKSTINIDLAYVLADSGDAFYGGVSTVQRMGHFNTAFRVNTSVPVDGETLAVGRGTLIFTEISWTPHHTHDLVYINGFLGIDSFTSVARRPTAGGPLGRAGILFAAVGLGRFGAPLSNQASDVLGGSIGYQRFFSHTRKQIVLEVGGRKDTNGVDQAEAAVGFRYQQAVGRRTIARLDAFAAARQQGSVPVPRGSSVVGGRFEIRVKF